jgi:hypothetical protein
MYLYITTLRTRMDGVVNLWKLISGGTNPLFLTERPPCCNMYTWFHSTYSSFSGVKGREDFWNTGILIDSDVAGHLTMFYMWLVALYRLLSNWNFNFFFFTSTTFNFRFQQMQSIISSRYDNTIVYIIFISHLKTQLQNLTLIRTEIFNSTGIKCKWKTKTCSWRQKFRRGYNS